MTESVDESSFDEGSESSTLLVGESGAFAVGFWASEVNFFMGDVKITTEEDGLTLGFQRFEVTAEDFIPTHAI